jgi:hypothetical protein
MKPETIGAKKIFRKHPETKLRYHRTIYHPESCSSPTQCGQSSDFYHTKTKHPEVHLNCQAIEQAGSTSLLKYEPIVNLFAAVLNIKKA